MKKLAIILAASMAMAAGTTAFAATATYDSENNKATVGNDINSYSTVIITKDADSSIAYVDQSSSAFSATMDFFLKDDPAAGDYTVVLGNASGNTQTAAFTISGAVEPDLTTQQQMSKLQDEESNGDGTYNLAFTLTDDITDYNVITIKVGDKVGGFLIEDVFEYVSGTVNLGLQVNNVPEEYKESIEVYLGNGTLGQSYVDWDAE